MENNDMDFNEALAGYLQYVQSVQSGEIPERHECHGGCRGVRFGADVFMKGLCWEEACGILRPLLTSAMTQIEQFTFCLAWTIQGPKRNGAFIRLSMAFPYDAVSHMTVGAYFRGEQSHAVYGTYARLFADCILQEGDYRPDLFEDITHKPL